MELIELEKIWKDQDEKMARHIRLNKEILRRVLISKPEKRVNWIKAKAVFNMFSPLILALLVSMMNIRFQMTLQFYIGLGMFLVTFLTIYLLDVKYFLWIRKIDFSEAIVVIKKSMAVMEKQMIHKTRIRYALMPFSILGILLMLIQNPVFNVESMVFFGLVIVVFGLSFYFYIQFAVYERFRSLNKEIQEVEELELM